MSDLLWTSENISEESAKKFGFNGKEEIQFELERANAAIQGSEKLQGKLEKRERELKYLRDGMIETGVLTEEQARNPHYFRNQVLEYAAIRGAAGQGKKVTTPYWHGRHGSEKDINVNYYQAEAEWMFKANVDTSTARFLGWLKDSKYNQAKVVKKFAKDSNNANIIQTMKDEIADAMPENDLADRDYKVPRDLIKALKDMAKQDPEYGKVWANRNEQLPKLAQYAKFNQRIAMSMGNFQGILNATPDEVLDQLPKPIRELAYKVRKDAQHDDAFKLYGFFSNDDTNPDLQQAPS